MENFNKLITNIIDINECLTNNGGCNVTLGICSNTPGSRTCACKTGYSGDGFTCNGTIFIIHLLVYLFLFYFEIDINECSTNNGGCHATLATCTNTIGSFTCACISGYSGNGVTCTGNNYFFLKKWIENE